MKRTFFAAVAFALTVNSAAAQQQPDPAALQKAISVLQLQRNQAMDAAAMMEVKAASLADDLAKAQARIKELEPKSEPKKE